MASLFNTLRRVHTAAPRHAKNVAILHCPNALGQTISMIVIKVKCMKAECADKWDSSPMATAFCNIQISSNYKLGSEVT